MLRNVIIGAVALIALLTNTIPVIAAPPGYDLTLTVRTPTWSSRDGYISNWNATEVGGSLKLNNLIPYLPNLHPFVSGLTAIGDHTVIFDAKNEFQAGCDYTLGRGFTFSTWYDKHFTKDVDRVFVALRYNTHGLF